LPEWPADDSQSSDVLSVSGLDGRGIDALLARLSGHLSRNTEAALDSFNQRQAQQLRRGLSCLEDATQALDAGVPLDAVCMDVYAARDAFFGIYEQPSRSEIVNLIFSGFCVGK
jgi:tRNA modification GTPase